MGRLGLLRPAVWQAQHRHRGQVQPGAAPDGDHEEGGQAGQPLLLPRLVQISPATDCVRHLGEEGKRRLCLYQEQEPDIQAHYRMLGSNFQPWQPVGPQQYGVTALEPAVGDAGAPVVAYHGQYQHLCLHTPTICTLYRRDRG